MPLPSRPTWFAQALCHGHGNLFFSGEKGDQVAAKRICRECPVRMPCLTLAVSRRESFGVWGGLDTDERETFRQRLARDTTGSTASTTKVSG